MKKLWNNKNTKDIFAFCEEYKVKDLGQGEEEGQKCRKQDHHLFRQYLL